MDLDLHLYICGECEVFYNVRNCLGANLAADITNGFGPETITIDNTMVIYQGVLTTAQLWLNLWYKFFRRPWTTVSLTILLCFNSKV